MLKAVIFDVGGVLIRTHSRAGREKWADRLRMEPREFEDFVFGGESGRLAQLGHKTAGAHWRWLQDHFRLDEAELAEMRRDFFAGDVLDQSLLDYIERLRAAGYRTGLLSNTADNARELWAQVYPLLEYFDGIVISAEVGLMKPDPRIYHLAADSLGVQVDEALFVDDFLENINGARRVGMSTLYFTDPQVVQRQLVTLTGVSQTPAPAPGNAGTGRP